jgi:hypothetical protein
MCVCVVQREKLFGESGFENCCLLHVMVFGQVAVYSHFGGGGFINSVEDRGQREWGSGGGSLLVRGSTQFANE